MNKMKKYLMMFAALVATTVGFTACSSEDDLASAEQEGSGVVKTDFTISFPKQMSGTTRQTTEIVQGQDKPVFRGITGIELMPFTAAKSGINASSTIPSSINLAAGTVGKQGASSATANTIDAQYALYPNSNSHLYTDIEIAIGTRAFMFYGKAIDAAAATGSNLNATNGSLVKSVAPSGTTLDAISFSLTDITTATVDAQATAIAAYLTNIAKANSGTETMLTYFPNFTNLKAGSYASMKAVVQAVYTSLYKNTDALSTAIKNVILAGYTPSGASAKTITVAEKSGTTTGELVFTSTYTYPRNIFLPDGAAQINWNENKFDVVITNNVGLNISAINDYTYPAALYYYGLSDIWAVPVPMSGLYDDNKTWADIVKAYTDRNDESATVQSTTRSIAIRDEVQYAVGRLDVTVKSNNGATTLKDNSNVDIALETNGANFPIKGILVGNQKAVKYNFETNTSAASKTIYDSQMPDGATLYPGSSPTVKTHTLVLQTVDATSDDDTNANVPIAIEFENAGTQIIVGKDNELIYPGTRFYLIGTLKPNKNDTQKYSTDANAAVIKKAFVQDYITTANFTVESFKNAYHTLPDLRTPSLEIGLSVDLTWKTGITQGIIIQ